MSLNSQLVQQRELLKPSPHPVTVIGMKSVVCSGTIVSRGDEPVSFMPFLGFASDFFIALSFKATFDGKPDLSVIYAEKRVEIHFINMRSAFELGTSRPVPLFSWYEDYIYLNVVFSTVGEGEFSTRVIHYTIFNAKILGPESLKRHSDV